MLRIGLMLGALFALTAPAAAQNVRLAKTGALSFNMGGLFASTPGAFDDIGIGGRWFLNEGLAIRGALGVNLSTDKTENDSDSIENSTSLYALEGGAEIVIARGKSAYLYTGGILQVSSFEDDPHDETGNEENNTSRTGLTVAGIIGATYFVADSLSIGAEYRLGVTYASQEREGSELTESTTTIGTGTAGFHLSFWFK
jgi:opacity protein-like surface antigen